MISDIVNCKSRINYSCFLAVCPWLSLVHQTPLVLCPVINTHVLQFVCNIADI